MRILVTGATGQVGRRFVPRLLRRAVAASGGGSVRVLVRDAARAEPFAELGAEVMEGDLRDGKALRAAVEGMDAVVNVAAAFRGVAGDETWAVCRDAAVELGEAALEAGVGRFVQVSTTLVYGAGYGRPAVEDDEPQPLDTWGDYPAAKLAAERHLLGLHRERGFDVRVARLAFVYGEGDPHLAQSLRWAGNWAAHHRLHLVHHADVAQGVQRVLLADGIAGRIYNIADDAPATAVELHQLAGVEPPADAPGRPLPDPWEGIASTLRLRDELGFRPLYPSVWTARDAGVL